MLGCQVASEVFRFHAHLTLRETSLEKPTFILCFFILPCLLNANRDAAHSSQSSQECLPDLWWSVKYLLSKNDITLNWWGLAWKRASKTHSILVRESLPRCHWADCSGGRSGPWLRVGQLYVTGLILAFLPGRFDHWSPGPEADNGLLTRRSNVYRLCNSILLPEYMIAVVIICLSLMFFLATTTLLSPLQNVTSLAVKNAKQPMEGRIKRA